MVAREKLTHSTYLKVTIPFILSTATQPLLGAANTALMGNMPSPAYVAAISLGVIFLNNVYWLLGFLRVATTTFAAQAAGRDSAEDTLFAFGRPLLLALVLGCGFLLVHPWLLELYIGFMDLQGAEVGLLREFLRVAVFSAPFVLLNYVMIGWLMGQFLICQTMVMQISMNLLNILLAVVMVVHYQAGIAGLAWSMVLAQAYGFVVGIILVYRCGRLQITRELLEKLLDFHQFKSLLAMQLDLMIRTVCLLTINNLFARAGAAMGTEYLAANAILLELVYIISFMIDGMANGVSVFAGRAWGARRYEELQQVIKIALQQLMAFCLVAALIVLLGRDWVLQLMTSQLELLEIAGRYAFYLAIHPFTAGIGLLLYGVYTSSGYTSFIRNMMLMAAVLFYLAQLFLLPLVGNHGVWWTYILTYGFESLAYGYGLRFIAKRYKAAL